MVILDWDLRGYLSHLGNHLVVHYIPETAQGVMTDALSISFLFLLKRDSGSQSQTKSQGGWMAQWCRLQTACSRWGTVRLPQCLILWQDMAAIPTLFFSSDYLWANMYNFPTFWIRLSLWTSLSFLCFRTQPGWKMRSWATKVTRQPWVSGQGAEFLGLGEVTDHRQSHLDGEMYF